MLALVFGGFVAVDRSMIWWQGPGPLPEAKTIVLLPGGVEAVGAQLAAADVVDKALFFVIAAKVSGSAARLKLGEYAFPAHVTPEVVIGMLSAGKTVVHRLVVPEGFTTAEVLAEVAAAPTLTGPVPTDIAEGTIWPDTYFYSYGDSRAALVTRMTRAMTKELEALWARRIDGLPLKSPDQAVILASIVEKETGIASERTHVASVFYNRLKQGMKLQSDPTVIYAITKGEKPLGRPLSHADLDIVSPYNTYVVAGLPPGPIANPGQAAILAVLRPARTKDLYFVADGSGGHAFADNVTAHNRNVTRLRQSEKTPATVAHKP